MVEGQERVELLGLDSEDPMLVGEIGTLTESEDSLDYVTRQAMVRILKEKLEEYGKENPRMLKEVFPNLMMVTDLGELLDQIAIQLPWDYKNRQKVLECVLPVSYTHLDVYKRQAIWAAGSFGSGWRPVSGIQRETAKITCFMWRRARWQMKQRGAPVSYTHLDVYKRQTAVWVCPCLMHGPKTTRFLHLDTMQTVMQLQRSQKATAERSASMQMFRHI